MKYCISCYLRKICMERNADIKDVFRQTWNAVGHNAMKFIQTQKENVKSQWERFKGDPFTRRSYAKALEMITGNQVGINQSTGELFLL